MGTRNISILVKVSDSVYDMVVLPHKRSKTFAKLMATLLQGYIENDYIRSYAEGTLDEMHRASVDALDDVLGEMHQSLQSMGFYTDELKNTTTMGKEIFEEKLNESSSEVNNPTRDAEVEELRSTVSELKEQNTTIIDMLKDLLESGVSLKSASTSQQHGETKKHTSEETPISMVKKKPKEIVEDTPTSVSSTEANNMLANLLVGNSFSF